MSVRIGGSSKAANAKSKSSKSNKKSKKSVGAGLFSKILGSEPVLVEQADAVVGAQEVLGELDELGAELRLRQSMGALEKYKRKLKDFLKRFAEQSQQGLCLFSDGAYGAHQQMQLMQSVDRELADITRRVMEGEKSHIDLAASIDNIKGLLINCLR